VINIEDLTPGSIVCTSNDSVCAYFVVSVVPVDDRISFTFIHASRIASYNWHRDSLLSILRKLA
jgi:hypothetical protein